MMTSTTRRIIFISFLLGFILAFVLSRMPIGGYGPIGFAPSVRYGFPFGVRAWTTPNFITSLPSILANTLCWSLLLIVVFIIVKKVLVRVTSSREQRIIFFAFAVSIFVLLIIYFIEMDEIVDKILATINFEK